MALLVAAAGGLALLCLMPARLNTSFPLENKASGQRCKHMAVMTVGPPICVLFYRMSALQDCISFMAAVSVLLLCSSDVYLDISTPYSILCQMGLTSGWLGLQN